MSAPARPLRLLPELLGFAADLANVANTFCVHIGGPRYSCPR